MGNAWRFFCVALGLLAAGCVFAAQVTDSFRLPVGNATGFKQQEGTFVPLAEIIELKANTTVAFEAEGFDESTWNKDGGVRMEGDISFAKNFKRLRYYVGAQAPLTLSLWARIRQEAGDRGVAINGNTWWETCPADKVNAWRWVKLGEMNFPVGMSSIQLVPTWMGGVEIDSFALLSDKTAKPDGQNIPAATKMLPPAFALESDELQLGAAQKLLTAVAMGNVMGSIVEASADGGATWKEPRELPLNGRLKLRARFATGAIPDNARVTGFTAQIACDSAGYLSATSNYLKIGFDLQKAGIIRLESPILRTTFALPTAAIPLFTLDLKQPGKPWKTPSMSGGAVNNWASRGEILEPKDGKLESAEVITNAGNSQIVLVYSFLEGKLRATATIALVKKQESGWSQESAWSLKLENNSDWDIVTYTFPRIAGLKVGDDGYDDWWVNTNRYGPWAAASQPEDRPYPGWGALGWVDLGDEHAGIGFYTDDNTEGSTDFRLRPTWNFTGQTSNLETAKLHCVPAGTEKTWNYTTLVHSGDWHATADAYGDFFRAKFGEADWPEWVKDENGWIQASIALADSSMKFSQMPAMYETGRRMGLNHLQVWGQFGGNVCSAFWWPSPKYGTLEEFKAINKGIRDQGGHIGYYLMYDRENRYNYIDDETYEGYLPRTRYPKDVPMLTVDELIKGAMVSDPEGKENTWPKNEQEMADFKANLASLLKANKLTTWAGDDDKTWTDKKPWPGSSMVGMNPLDKVWQDHMVNWVNTLYMGQWNCDTAYLDVMAIGNVGRSFDLKLGDDGQIYNGEMAMAKRLADEARAINPDYVVSGEGKSELVTRYAMGMTSNAHYGWTDIAPLRYTHPQSVLFLGAANGGDKQLAYNSELDVLYGGRFEVSGQDQNRVHKTVRFRETFKRYSLRAKYKDTVGIAFEGEGIDATRHDRFTDDCRTILVTVVNRSGTDKGRVTVDVTDLNTGKYGAIWITDDGDAFKAEKLPTVDMAGRTHFSAKIPTARISALLLTVKAPKDEDLLGGIIPSLEPGKTLNKVWVANLSDKEREVTLSLDGPGLKGMKDKVTLEPYGVFSATIDGKLIAGEKNYGYVYLRAEQRQLAENYLYPLVENGSYEDNGTEVADAPDGKRIRHMLPSKDWQGDYRVLPLQPSRTYRVSFKGRRDKDGGGTVRGIIILTDNAKQNSYIGMDFPAGKFNEWIPFTTEFTTKPDFREASIYLYNFGGETTVDYDDIRVELLK